MTDVPLQTISLTTLSRWFYFPRPVGHCSISVGEVKERRGCTQSKVGGARLLTQLTEWLRKVERDRSKRTVCSSVRSLVSHEEEEKRDGQRRMMERDGQ